MTAKGAPSPPKVLDPEDYYFEGPLTVFTAAYHLKRGYCCGSGCRHCPYGNSPKDRGTNTEDGGQSHPSS